MQELISVIVPVYNVEKYIRKSLDSIQNQTYKNLEIILVDDGSTDSSGTICDEYADKDERFKVIHKTNGGLSDARNAGVRASTGKFIGFVDSDDYIIPTMYEELKNAMEENSADIAVCNFETVDEEGKPIPEENTCFPVQDKVITGKEAICNLSGPRYTYWTTAWNRLYRRDVVEQVSFPVGKIHEDEFTAHLFYDKCEKVVGVSTTCYKYVVRANSIMTKKYGKRNLDYFEALNNRIQYCAEQNMQELTVQFTSWMLQKLLLVYPLLNLEDREVVIAYQYCIQQYLETYQKIKKSFGMKKTAIFGTMLLKISPRFASYIMCKLTKNR